MRPPWGFRGQLVLAGSESRELRLNQWRVYDPEVGQYVTPEPLALSGEAPVTHGYAYARSSPVDYVDPDGRTDEAAVLIGGFAMAPSLIFYGCIAAGIYFATESGEDDTKDQCADDYTECHDRIGDRMPSGRGGHKSICAYCQDQCELDGYWPSRTASGIPCPRLP